MIDDIYEIGVLMKRRIGFAGGATRLLALACGLAASMLWAQKPKSQKEVDALRAIQAATTPDEQIKAIENVLTNFADTEFKVVLLQTAMQIEEQKGDFAQT